MTLHTETVTPTERSETFAMCHFTHDGIDYQCAADWPDPQSFSALEALASDGWPWVGQPKWFLQLKNFEQDLRINQGSHYLLLRVYQQQQLCLILPIRTSDNGRSFNALSNYYSPEFAPLYPIAPAYKQSVKRDNPSPTAATHWPLVMKAMSLLWPDWRQLRLWPLTSITAAQIQQYSPTTVNALTTHFGTNWRATAQSSAHYWQQRQSQLVNTIRRKRKKLVQQGGDIQIHRQLTPELVAAYWQVYQHSWKQPEPSQHFINWLLEFSSENGQLRLGLLRINGVPVAFQFWLVQQQQAAIVKLAQDQAFDSLSPGTVLMAAMIDEVMDQDGVTSIDFLTGNDDYKAQWMDHNLPLLQLELFNCQSVHGKLRFALKMLHQQLKQLIQKWHGQEMFVASRSRQRQRPPRQRHD